jgi:hypothetical protein
MPSVALPQVSKLISRFGQFATAAIALRAWI